MWRMRLQRGDREWAFVAILAVMALGHLLVRNAAPFVDENDHVGQIEIYRSGSFAQHPELTTFQGYHLTLWGISSLLRVEDLGGLRLFSCLFGLASVVAFYCCAAKRDRAAAPVRTLHYFLLPILFPYFFLVYTDPFAMLLLLLAVYGYFNQRYSFAGVCGGLSILVRQSNVVWICMLLAMAYVDAYGLSLRPSALWEHVKRCWLFILVIAGFVLFVALNRDIALGSIPHYPVGVLRLENVFFALAACSFLFLPALVACLPDIRRLVRARPWLLIIGVVLAGLYLLSFTVDHPFNSSPYFLRNRVLTILTSSIALKALLLPPIFFALLFLAVTPLNRRSAYLLYPFSLLSLLPFWLIETRYYIPPIALFLLFKGPEPFEQERRLVLYWGALSALLFALILSRRAFP